MGWRDNLIAQLRRDEGERDKPYLDTRGNITIGVGRNLTAVGVDTEERDLMLSKDVDRAVAACRALVHNFDLLTDARKEALANMAFNLGFLRFARFRKMLVAVEEGDFESAAAEALDSQWSKQVGAGRSNRIADKLREG